MSFLRGATVTVLEGCVLAGSYLQKSYTQTASLEHDGRQDQAIKSVMDDFSLMEEEIPSNFKEKIQKLEEVNRQLMGNQAKFEELALAINNLRNELASNERNVPQAPSLGASAIDFPSYQKLIEEKIQCIDELRGRLSATLEEQSSVEMEAKGLKKLQLRLLAPLKKQLDSYKELVERAEKALSSAKLEGK